MPLLPERLLPSRLESWLTLLGDFSKVESADPLKPPRRLPTSSLLRPRRDIELALLKTFCTALSGGEVTGEAVGDSIARTREAEGRGLGAPRSLESGWHRDWRWIGRNAQHAADVREAGAP